MSTQFLSGQSLPWKRQALPDFDSTGSRQLERWQWKPRRSLKQLPAGSLPTPRAPELFDAICRHPSSRLTPPGKTALLEQEAGEAAGDRPRPSMSSVRQCPQGGAPGWSPCPCGLCGDWTSGSSHSRQPAALSRPAIRPPAVASRAFCCDTGQVADLPAPSPARRPGADRLSTRQLPGQLFAAPQARRRCWHSSTRAAPARLRLYRNPHSGHGRVASCEGGLTTGTECRLFAPFGSTCWCGINRDLGGQLDPEAFTHRGPWH